MSITPYHDKQALADWAQRAARLASQRDPQAVETVDRAVRQLQSDRLVLTVIGKAKRGKSTLINALLGRSDDVVAPIDKLPASSAVSRFSRADRESAVVIYRDGRRESIIFQQVREYVTEERNPENRKEVAVVEIAGPFAALDPDLEIVDTPGAGSLHTYHDEILHGFLPQSDAVIFLVSARMPLDQDELALLSKVKAADIGKVFFAINRVDEASPQDLADAVTHNRQLLAQVGVPVETIHRLSAKRAFQGDLAGSGVPELCDAIQGFLTEGKSRMLAARFVSRVGDAIQPVLEGLEIETAGRQKSLSQLDGELAALRDQQRVIETERQCAEREFQLAWTAAVMGFEESLEQAKGQIKSEIAQQVASAGLTEVSPLAKRLPTQLTRLIEDRLAPASQEFETTARAACEKLQGRYPAIDVRDAGAISIRTGPGAEWLSGAAGGTVVAATGAGLAIAGGATAAAIAAANTAALAATATVAAPSIVSSLLTMGGLEVLAPLATGTATMAAPTAITAAPLWVALAGPVGWTLAGVGLLAVPFSWRLSKLKLRDKLEEACQDQVHQVFKRMQTERLPRLREMGHLVLEEFRVRLDRQLSQIEGAMLRAREGRTDPEAGQRTAQLASELRAILVAPPSLISP